MDAVGRGTKESDYGEGPVTAAGFPLKAEWFRDNRDWGNLWDGLRQAGLSRNGVDGIMGGNWPQFYETSFSPANSAS